MRQGDGEIGGDRMYDFHQQWRDLLIGVVAKYLSLSKGKHHPCADRLRKCCAEKIWRNFSAPRRSPRSGRDFAAAGSGW